MGDTSFMGQVIFVTCRESVEALLVVGILYAWIQKNPDARKGKPYLYGGIVAGLLLAALLAVALMGVYKIFGERGQEIFTIVMLLVAAALIVQMVLWMKNHSRSMKKDLEAGMKKSVETSQWWGIFVLTAIAIGREGSETVMFLFGTFSGLKTGGDYFMFFLAFLIGLGIALFLFYLLQVGSRFISWKWFFLVTEVLLLFLGGALFMTSIGNLYNLIAEMNVPDWFYWFNRKAWNISGFMPDSSGVGSFLSSIIGYRAQPAYIELIAFVVYWAVVLWLLRLVNKKAEKPKAVKA